MAIRVGINGFGRIGRLAYRAGVKRGGFEFVGINDLVPADNLAYLLRYDTAHGRFDGTVAAHGENEIHANDQVTKCFSERDPAALPWGDNNVDYVIESTGLFTDMEGASKHFAGGAKRTTVPPASDSSKPRSRAPA